MYSSRSGSLRRAYVFPSTSFSSFSPSAQRKGKRNSEITVSTESEREERPTSEILSNYDSLESGSDSNNSQRDDETIEEEENEKYLPEGLRRSRSRYGNAYCRQNNSSNNTGSRGEEESDTLSYSETTQSSPYDSFSSLSLSPAMTVNTQITSFYDLI
jgi:hypothetical protein